MSRRRKVLLSAYACEPDRGSESGVGWNWVRQIARFHDVWVVTRANNRGAIEQALEQDPLPQASWVYFDLPGWMCFWKKGQQGVHLYYLLWQIGVYQVVKKIHAKEKFDLIHHLTFGSYWLPSFLVFLPAPFIWGPLGGGESTPKPLLASFRWRGRLYEWGKEVIQRFSVRNPLLRLSARRAAMILANTDETRQKLLCLHPQGNVIVYPHMGVASSEIPHAVESSTGSLQLVSVGRLLHWKGFHLGLMAFAQFQPEFPDTQYWLIGEGPERSALERLATDLGIAHQVRFCGPLARKDVLLRLRECHVLVHPAVHDSCPAVCLEAMAAGCPVICLDLGGPALQITPRTGFKIPVQSFAQVLDGLADAMRRLATDPVCAAQMGAAAQKRIAEEFEWTKKGEHIAAMYQEVL